MKGFAFGLLFVAILGLLAIWTTYVQIGIRDSGVVLRSAREIEIVKDINKMEFFKKSQEPALKFSFYEAYDFLGGRGGFYDLTNIQSYDCIPYWRVYDDVNDDTNLQKLKENIEQTSSIIFNNYMDVFLSDKIYAPSYDISILNNPPYPQNLDVEALALDDIELRLEKVKISENSVFSHQVNSALFDEFKIGLNELADTEKIKNAVEDGINSANIDGMSTSEAEEEIDRKIREKISELEQDIDQSLAGTDFDIEVFQIEISVASTSAAANVLVTVENRDKEYLIGNELKTISLKFRILDGNLIITPPTNPCTETL